MDFSGPDATDLANVESLNRAFLRCLRNASHGRQLRQQLVPAIRPVLERLTDLQIDHLAVVPFLLLSLRERDDDYWHVLFGDEANMDLLPVADAHRNTAQLVAAELAFLWALARRNAYAARLVSGAPLNWCEHLADSTLFRLLERTHDRCDLPQPRLAANESFWSKLLGPGLSVESEVRRAAHLAALQSILTVDPTARYRPMRAAACRTQVPSLRVADKNKRP